jgi:hypothetical protein
MFILFKIKYISGQTLSIGNLQRVNTNDKNWYSEFIINFIELKASFYKETQIESLIFSYGFKDGKVKNKQEIIYDGLYQNYNNYQIPISTNPMDYGLLINKIDMKDSVAYFLHNEKGLTIAIRTYIDHNLIEFFKSGTTLLKFTDELIDKNKFMRRIGNKIFTFKDGRQILLSSELKTKFISKSSKCKYLVNKFITIDIETYITDGLLTPYLICFYDGKNFFSFYLSDYNSVEEMMLECLKSILKRKYKGYTIYAHNLAKFDIIFLLKYLLKLGSIKPIIHNGKIISLRVNYGENNEYRIEFKDSLLLLLASLDSLCKSFKIEESKTIFPHLFVNENNLNYNGEVPKIDDFLSDIVKKFPNLSQDTLEKLSTPEGLKNRVQIIESLSEDELKIDVQASKIDWKGTFDKSKENASDADLATGKSKITQPFSYYISKEDQIERGIEDKDIRKLPTVKDSTLKEMSNMSKEEVIKMDKIVKASLKLDAESVVEKLTTEIPGFNFNVDSYKEKFMKAMQEEIDSGKTEKDKARIRKQIQDVDLLELQNTGGTSNIKDIRNVIRENYTHNTLLKEIKSKASQSSFNTNQLDSTNQLDNSSQSSFNTNQLDDTMNLFE